ncbi:hypothetical protein IW140_004929 [Coemansia sp. RSA 1813]|nr:hypothetical protein EV178_005222 [Coemansia sp. RSA 1646]KAJ1771911.1 hypothetical protein LPJ74_001945 [Coemansia sp. RSA 1843]KAJ2087374.1 hypothetical protein IW138_004991 [Coemansia sp. RSA 986]KAJ2212245.1 hypothetical protein EV179_004796 [Coemansia sp. RSA 487]KAJ2566460.1 hypothetical protein IW140_004929 [Coemansia sp. RSA 1813]
MAVTAHPQEHSIGSTLSLPRRRVKQLSSVKAWCQTYGMEVGQDSDVDIVSYESFPDLRKLLEVECAEIERKELEEKATLEARIRRRNSDSSSEASSIGSRSVSECGGAGIMGSLYRLIDPLIPGIGAASSSGGPSGGR